MLEKRFLIKRTIGSGGMGIVYEAVDTHHNGTVALKLLHTVNAAGIYRLKQEFRALIDVIHPNLARLHELFSDGDRWFFTMDLVTGKPLVEGLGANAGVHSIRKAFSQLAAGIHAIHLAGKLHADLKPSNALLSPEGKVTILDFGLVTDQKGNEPDSGKKNTSVFGTPLYMAPEQTVFENATAASDWYAFGVMLFEAIARVTPFSGPLRTLLLNKRYREAPSVSSLRSDISPDLNKLCAKLLVRDPLARAGYADVVEVLGRPSTDSAISLRQGAAPFVGRDTEIGQLFEAFHIMEQGKPVIAMVQGLSGIGKTALVEHFLHRVQSPGKTVTLSGRCYERESVPYKGCDSLIDHLSRYLKHLPEEQAARLLPHNILSLSHMFPALHRLEVVKKTTELRPLPADSNERRIAAFTALKNLLSRITEREPLILFVDDLQWCDEDGAKLLSSLVSPPNPPSILLVAAYRSEESDESPGLRLFLERVSKLDNVPTYDMPIGRLDGRAAKNLAEKLLPEEIREYASRVVAESDCSPYFIYELVRYGSSTHDRGKLTLEETIKNRIDTLPPADREILEAICVSNGPIRQAVLKTLIKEENIEPGLRRLRDQNFIVYVADHSGSIRTYHDRVRETVIAELELQAKQMWHTRFSSTLETMGPSHAVLLTNHLQLAGQTEKAGICAAQAADQAFETLAFGQAANLYKKALELHPGDRESERSLQIQLAKALSNTGKGPAAAEVYLQAAKGAPLRQEMELRQRAATQLITTGHFEKGNREFNHIMKAVGIRPYKSQASAIVSFLIHRALLKIRGLRFKKQSVQQVNEGDLLKLRAYQSAWQGLSLSDPLRSAAYSMRYLRLALQLGLTDDIVLGLSMEATQLSIMGTRNRATIDAYFDHTNKLIGQVEDARAVGYFSFAMANSAWFLGDLKKAPQYLELADNIYRNNCESAVWELTVLKSIFGLVRCWLGSWGNLQPEWDEWTKDAEERGDLYLLTAQRLWPMGATRWLAADRPDKVWKMLSVGLNEAPTDGKDIIVMFVALAASYTNIYCGNYLDAFHPLEKKLKTFSKTPPGRYSQLIKIIMHYRLAYAALAHALVTRYKNKFLNIAERRARMLIKDNSAMARAYVPVIRAAIAHQKGDDETATALLQDAIDAFDGLEYKLYAAASRRQLGRLFGGDKGKALVTQADQTMGEEDIANPERIAAMLAPGFFL